MNENNRRPPMTTVPCPRCLKLAIDGHVRPETVMPLPEGAFAPLGHNRQKCCFDCQSADNLARILGVSFESRRIAVGNDRQECLRLPAGIQVADAMGLIKAGYVKNWPSHEDFEVHLKWLDLHVWPLIPPSRI
jgi:hypothetical protein